MVDVSVIVPIYKVEKYLERCLDSLLKQTYKNIEIILVDDGSPDRCGEICDQYAAVDERVKVIHKENQGTGMARNSGLDVAKGTYIYFCDPDDYVDCHLIEDNVRIAEQHQANMVIFGHYDEMIDQKKQVSVPVKPDFPYIETQEDFRCQFEQLYKQNIMFTLWNKLYSKAFLDTYNCRFENQKVGQDTVFNYKVYEHLDKVCCNSNPYYHHVLDRTDSATNIFRENRFQIRYDETVKLEALITKWGYNEKYRQLLLNDWATTLSHGMNNLFFDQCPYTIGKKKEKLKEMVNTSNIKLLVEGDLHKDVYNRFMRMQLLLIKNRQLMQALWMVKFKLFVKEKLPIVKTILKN